MELGRSRPSGETPAQHYPRSMRRARRLPAPALGVLAAALVAAASWPAAASAGSRTTSPGPGPVPTPAATARPRSQGCAVGAGLGLAEPWLAELKPGLAGWMLAEAAAGQLAATISTAVRAPSAGAVNRRARRIERG